MKRIFDLLKKNKIISFIIAFAIVFSLSLNINYVALATNEGETDTAEVTTTEPDAEVTVEPTAEATAEPTADIDIEPTLMPTEEPTEEPTMTPTAEPTAEPTLTPTAEPTVMPTVAPTIKPTIKPTSIPTKTPATVAPTATNIPAVSATPAINTGVIGDNTMVPVITPTIAPTLQVPTIEPTPVSPTPNYIPDFTIPPAEYEGSEEINNENTGAEESQASAGIVEITDIDVEDKFQVYDIVKYLAYVFFGIAAIAILYGLVCVVSLLFFKKDISIGAIKKKRKAKKKEQEKGIKK